MSVPPVRGRSSELARARNSYLRGGFVRRRTGRDHVPSSGQHSLTGGRQIPKSPTPLRRTLTGGRRQLLLGLSSPELVPGGDSVLRLGFVRRRIACDRAPNSGQHSLAGGRRIPKSPTPSRMALTGGRHQLLLRVFRRSWCESEIRTSDERRFAGGQSTNPRPAPANVRLHEEDEYRIAHLRREGRSPEESTSSC